MSSWIDDLVGDLDKATQAVTKVTGAVQNVVSAIPIRKTTTATPATPPQGETTPKQAQVETDTAKPSAIPWGLLVAGLVIVALVEWG